MNREWLSVAFFIAGVVEFVVVPRALVYYWSRRDGRGGPCGAPADGRDGPGTTPVSQGKTADPRASAVRALRVSGLVLVALGVLFRYGIIPV